MSIAPLEIILGLGSDDSDLGCENHLWSKRCIAPTRLCRGLHAANVVAS